MTDQISGFMDASTVAHMHACVNTLDMATKEPSIQTDPPELCLRPDSVYLSRYLL